MIPIQQVRFESSGKTYTLGRRGPPPIRSSITGTLRNIFNSNAPAVLGGAPAIVLAGVGLLAVLVLGSNALAFVREGTPT